MYPTIAHAGHVLRTGTTTSVELTRSALAMADALDPDLGVYVTRLDDQALAQAARADAQLAAGDDRGPLHGIPLGVKDIIAMRGADTTAQSLVLDRAWGRERGDAPVVARLRAAGAVITGKLTTMEFAIGVPDVAKPFPVPRNPWDVDTWAGGSSSGAASGIAAGLVLGAIGTDTGGSVRIPASYCGVSALKPTFGRVPKSGCVPLGYTYDHVGPMARSAEDCALLLGVLAGHDASDPMCADRPVDDYVSGLTGDLTGLRIGVDPLLGKVSRPVPEVDRLLAAAVRELAAAGAEVVGVDLPLYAEMSDVTTMGFQAEAFAYHRADLRARWHDYGAGTRSFIVNGALFSAADYVQMQRVRRLVARNVAALFDDVDVIVTPTMTGVAPPVDGLTVSDLGDTLQTLYWNATGSPALSVPMGFSDNGLPLGLQVVGRHFDEATVLAVGHAYQQRSDWHLRTPPLLDRALEG